MGSMPQTSITVRVQPGAKRSEIAGLLDGVLRVRVSAPAHEGKANEALLELLASALGMPRGRLRIIRGVASRNKVLVVDGLEREELFRRLRGP